jgi:hypothetical protein
MGLSAVREQSGPDSRLAVKIEETIWARTAPPAPMAGAAMRGPASDVLTVP